MNQIIVNSVQTNILTAQNYIRDELLADLAISLTGSKQLNCQHLPAMILSGKKLENLTVLLGKCKTELSKRYAKIKNLTLHHLSAITNRTDLLPLLCPQKIKIPQDDQGYTPIHFRALLTQSSTLEKDPYYQQFRKQCVKTASELTKKTQFGQTPAEVFKQAQSLDRLPTQSATEATDELSTGALFGALTPGGDLLLPDNLMCLGNSVQVNEIVAQRQTLFNNWQWMTPAQTFNSKDLLNAYEIFLKTPPKVSVQAFNDKRGCGVIAKAPIKAKDILFSYNGEMIIQPQDNPDNISDYYYSLAATPSHKQGIDALHYRSIASMTNDGPPNIGSTFIFNHDGLAQKIVFFALKDIEPGEELVYCYGYGHTIKYLNYVISDQSYQQLIQLLKTSPYRFSQLFDLYQSTYGKSSELDHSMYSLPLKKRFYVDNFLYILNTPLVTHKLIQDGHLQENDYKKLFRKENMRYFQTIPMCTAHLIEGFVVAKLKAECEKQHGQSFFNEIFELRKAHFPRFMQANLKRDDLGRLLEHIALVKGMDYLLDGLERGDSFAKLKQQFESIYAQAPVYEHESREIKKQIVEKHLDQTNTELFRIIEKYQLIQF